MNGLTGTMNALTILREPMSREEREDGCPIYGGNICPRIFMDRYSQRYNNRDRPLFVGLDRTIDPPLDRLIWQVPDPGPADIDARVVTWPEFDGLDLEEPDDDFAQAEPAEPRLPVVNEYRDLFCVDLTSLVVSLSVVRRLVNGVPTIAFGIKGGDDGYSVNLSERVPSLGPEDTLDYAMTFALREALEVVRLMLVTHAQRDPPINKVFIRAPARHNLDYIYGGLAYAIDDMTSSYYRDNHRITSLARDLEDRILQIHRRIGAMENPPGGRPITVKFWNFTRQIDIDLIDNIASEGLPTSTLPQITAPAASP
ncbi:hypothetical protein B0T22DRAFT_485222 [Podospora appendiculata]|uniref:Uncharacterized protein n=1 Tax=Podospora appendiculata TaxID=314037 RepID=A0AAE0X0H7_9PEZI|nr:hypothetical protein B0T22DRAFT_485222 [Podospora appendiculata]